jgi:hypothetical protein
MEGRTHLNVSAVQVLGVNRVNWLDKRRRKRVLLEFPADKRWEIYQAYRDRIFQSQIPVPWREFRTYLERRRPELWIKEADSVARRFRPIPLPEGFQGAVEYRMSTRWDHGTTLWRSKRTKGRAQAQSYVSAAYKKKSERYLPVNKADPEGGADEGALNWKELIWERLMRNDKIPRPVGIPGSYSSILKEKFSGIAKGSRLTPERIAKLNIGIELRPAEKDLFLEMLFNREAALAYDYSHLGRIAREVAPPQQIRTVEHEPWQIETFRVPAGLQSLIIDMLKERMKANILEHSRGPYRNPWFLAKKQTPGTYRIINAATHMNKVTIKDANVPPNTEEFAEDFAGMSIGSLVDLYSGYDQCELHQNSRDMTAFMTHLGLLRYCTLPQGGTNSVAQFARIIIRILIDLIPAIARVFVDDVGVKGPRTTYNDEEALPGIRRYILEHIQNLDKVLYDLELAGACVSGFKSQFLCVLLKIVGYLCGPKGRTPQAEKVLKIMDWPSCKTAQEVRIWIGMCVYYRLWIKDFSIIAAPLYKLLRKGAKFQWTEDQQDAMDILKLHLVAPPALVPIICTEMPMREVILAVDASMKGWGSVLMQEAPDKKRRNIVRYDSGVFSEVEQKYDAVKRECRAAAKALKAVRFYLYGIQFVLETDALTLVAQLNRSATDVPGSVVHNWLAWIRMFDFEVRHVSGKSNSAADALSRKPQTPADELYDDDEDLEDFIDAQMNTCFIGATGVVDRQNVQESQTSRENKQADDTQRSELSRTTLNPISGYSEDQQAIASYLSTLRRPEDIPKRSFAQWKKKALKFAVQGAELFRRATKNQGMRKVIARTDQKLDIIHSLHEKFAHQGVESTYKRIARVYWWEGMYEEVKKHVLSCDSCQKRDAQKHRDTLHVSEDNVLFAKISIDVVHMPLCRGKKYLIVAREAISGWVEARALSDATSEAVAKFLWEDIITRHGIFGKLVVDGGSENKGYVKILAAKYGILRVQVSAYNARANGQVERGHKPIKDSLSKLENEGQGRWVDNLHLVLWADRTTTKRTTNMSPYEVLYGTQCVLPIESRIPTWTTLRWEEVRTTAELLEMRAKQMMRRDIDLEEATSRLLRIRLESKEAWDEDNNAEDRMYKVGDMVLVYNSRYEGDYTATRKMAFWWLGPYRISEADNVKGTYKIEELDGTAREGFIAGTRMKAYIQRETTEMPVQENPTSLTFTQPEEENQDAEEEQYLPETLRQYIPEGRQFAVVIPKRPTPPEM